MDHSLTIRGLTVQHGARPILRGVDLDIEPGKICALMGASGAGKSTALRAIVALQPFEAGSIQLGDVRLQPGPLPPESRLRAFRRKIGMVFQDHALFEHLTAARTSPLRSCTRSAGRARKRRKRQSRC